MHMASSPKRIIAFFVLALIAAPVFVNAFPFGGQITVYHVCHNATIFARLSPPVPGDYVYVQGHTKAYQFGPPRAVGQWLLGLTSIPYDCLWSVSPVYVQPAIAILMMGSSGPAAPARPGGQWGPGPGIPTTGGEGTPPTQTPPTPPLNPGGNPVSANGKIVISEIYYDVDASHGSEPENEWIEIYNSSTGTIDLSGWIVQDAGASDVLPSGTTLASGKFMVIAASSTAKNYWSIPTDAKFVSLDGKIGDGLSNTADFIRLRNTTNTIVDAASWGTDTTAFNPSLILVPEGFSLVRFSLAGDTDSASDWTSRSAPTPGKQ